jgi:sugar fermentation stimulation protein A
MKTQKELVQGYFLARLNRFCAQVKLGKREVLAHLPNSGRLKELLIPGTSVFLTRQDEPGRKTCYDLVLVKKGNRLISCDARLPNKVVHRALADHALAEIDDYKKIKQEAAFKGGRLDFLLTGGGSPWLIEVKSVTLVNQGVGLFPDAPTTRGTGHLRKLIEAVNQGYRAGIIFVVQRSDASSFAPNDAHDPDFGQALRQAHGAGVLVLAYACRVNRTKVTLYRPLPLLLQG